MERSGKQPGDGILSTKREPCTCGKYSGHIVRKNWPYCLQSPYYGLCKQYEDSFQWCRLANVNEIRGEKYPLWWVPL